MSGDENSLDAWLARVSAPAAPIQGEPGRWYRLGWLEATLASGRPPASAEVEEVADNAVRHTLAYVIGEIAQACNVKLNELAGKELEEQLAELVAMVADRFGGDPVLDDPFSDDEVQAVRPASEPTWHPPTEKPAAGAVIVVERGNANGGPVLGQVRGEYKVIQDPNGQDRWAVVDDKGAALVWHPSAVKRWRFV